ncbi:tyrosine-type recombinase/integrase [Priestia flexa]|uniref:site-specific integrase n=1 Tax=Priestia flexa TaxID=86664 RepID=UPI00240E9934|nr:site-specific integrase [Priestia flexa]WEZ09975.1 site-specific integrase [Priestia flexa]
MASFRKRSDKWEYRIKYTDPSTGKRREKTKGGFRTKKEAQIEAAEIEKQLYLGQHLVVKHQDMLVKDWFNEWLEVYGSQSSPKTLATRKNYINNVIIPSLGHFKIHTLSRSDYQRFINTLTTKYAKSTIQTIHSVFCTSINKAVESEILTHNRFKNVKINVEKDISEDKLNYLSKDELIVFIEAAKTKKLHHYIVASLLLRTGMRKGEMLALTWRDIDFENMTISITKTRDDSGTKPPKTKKSNRVISIDSTLVSELKKYQIWNKTNKLKYGSRYYDSEYVVISPNGKELGEYAVNKVIDGIIKKSNLHHLTPHGLRHTHAIMLLESGADIKFVSERLGHTTINMTAEVYIHITKKYETENVLKLERYLNN